MTKNEIGPDRLFRDHLIKLSIDLDYDDRQFTLYTSHLENNLKVVPIQKLDFLT